MKQIDNVTVTCPIPDGHIEPTEWTLKAQTRVDIETVPVPVFNEDTDGYMSDEDRPTPMYLQAKAHLYEQGVSIDIAGRVAANLRDMSPYYSEEKPVDAMVLALAEMQAEILAEES